MKIFLDTANLDEIRKGLAYGVIDGVTTNPTLISKEGKVFLPLIREITALVSGPVSVEVTGLTAEEMVEEGKRLAGIAENVVVKIPINLEGLKAVKILAENKIRTNVTLIFQPSQALMAAKAGASFVSPFVGRIDDTSGDGMAVVGEIIQIFSNYEVETEVIVASVRHALHFVQAALMGADIATIPLKTLTQLLQHPLTDVGMAQFLKDWGKVASMSDEKA